MKRVLLFAMLVIPMALLLSSCMVRRGVAVSSGPGGTHVSTYQYWYYPSIQVYFDAERKVYYYPENNGWRRASRLPAHFSVDSSYVTVESDSDRPYNDHSKHKMKYRYNSNKKNSGKEKRGHEDMEREDRENTKKRR